MRGLTSSANATGSASCSLRCEPGASHRFLVQGSASSTPRGSKYWLAAKELNSGCHNMDQNPRAAPIYIRKVRN